MHDQQVTWSYVILSVQREKESQTLASQIPQGMAKWQQWFGNDDIAWAAISTSLCVKSSFSDSFTSTEMVSHHILKLGHQFTVHFINDFLYFGPFLLLMAMPKLDILQ